MLARGGNAVDAAVATAITLAVVEPVSNGIGSDLFAIVWDGRELAGLNASGRAPAAATIARYAREAAMPQRGWEAVTIPGAVSGWVALSRRYGRLPFADLFEPAIRYARDGWLVSPVVAEAVRNGVIEFILKQIARDFIPKELIDRPKQPYRAPSIVGNVLARHRPLLDRYLSPQALSEAGIFSPAAVGRLIDKLSQPATAEIGNRDTMAFVAILSTQILHEHLIRGSVPDVSDAHITATIGK